MIPTRKVLSNNHVWFQTNKIRKKCLHQNSEFSEQVSQSISTSIYQFSTLHAATLPLTIATSGVTLHPCRRAHSGIRTLDAAVASVAIVSTTVLLSACRFASCELNSRYTQKKVYSINLSTSFYELDEIHSIYLMRIIRSTCHLSVLVL